LSFHKKVPGHTRYVKGYRVKDNQCSVLLKGLHGGRMLEKRYVTKGLKILENCDGETFSPSEGMD
jgi:hypothetical protein